MNVPVFGAGPGDARSDIDRALAAIDQAPRTEHGIIIPPHVAAARELDQAREQAPAAGPNRAQRRRHAKAVRRFQKAQARQEARRAAREQEHVETASERLKAALKQTGGER